jgi:hypothetical protein
MQRGNAPSAFVSLQAGALLAGVLIMGGLALAVGRSDARLAAADDKPPSKAPPPSYESLFPDWPEEKPAGVIVVSGQMEGYLRPCGCSLGQGGGLARRAGALKFLREDLKLQTLTLDLGDLTKEKVSALEELRIDAAIAGLGKLKYDGVALGKIDYKIQLFRLLSKFLNLPDSAPKIVTGNVTPKDKASLGDLFKEKCKSVEYFNLASGKVAVASLLHEDEAKDHAEIDVEPADQAWPRLLKEAQAGNPKLKILLGNMSKANAEALAEKYPGWDVVVSKSIGDDAIANNDQKRIGETLVVQVGRKGKTMGVVGWWPNRKNSLRYGVAIVNDAYPEDPELEEIYNNLVREIKDAGLLEKESKLPTLTGDQYVGDAVCGKCHTKAHAKWKSDYGGGKSHSHAWEALKKDKAKFQTHNPDCVYCHSTGFDYVSGFVSEEKTPHLVNNQCENCHGPGKRHSDDKDNPEFRKALKKSQFDIKSTCVQCHDGDNDPHFNFEKYWPKVAHPWKD